MLLYMSGVQDFGNLQSSQQMYTLMCTTVTCKLSTISLRTAMMHFIK